MLIHINLILLMLLLNGFFKDNNKDVEFKAENIAKSIGTNDAYLADDYTQLTDSAISFGFNDESNEKVVEPISKNGFEVKSRFLTSDKNYYATETVQRRSWTRVIDDGLGGEPEEVEYNWVTYKYVIDYTGTDIYAWDPFGINGGKPGFFNTSSTTVGEPEWKDTVICEYIVREKTTR